MQRSSFDFLRKLLDTPGPSGFETAPARVWREQAEQVADEVRGDVAGNTFATRKPGGAPHVMLAGHIDEIGLMVVHIDEEGFLYFQGIGGWDPQVLIGQRVVIAGTNGPVTGVIGKAAIHLMSTEERDKAPKIKDLWIDIGARDRDAARALVRVGDAAVIDASLRELPERRIASRSIDNRIGAFVVLEALRGLGGVKHVCAVTAVATSREEIGYTGGGARPSATALAPAVAIAVDVTHATDHPGAEKKEAGDIALGGGPVLSRGSSVNPVVFDLLRDVAEHEKIPYVVAAAPRDTGTDADAIHNAHTGVATGLISIPNRYMHTPNEMIDLRDVDAAVSLLTAFVAAVTPDTDFIPR